jgi:hypothetical protein
VLFDISYATEVALNNKVPFNRFISGFTKFRDTLTLKNNTEKYASQGKVQYKTLLKVSVSCAMAKEPK